MATCSSEGRQVVECAVCGAVIRTVTVPKTEHVAVYTVTKEPTCSEAGVETITCDVCKQVIGTNLLEKKPHTPVAMTERTATCMETGLIVEKCTVCGAVVSETETPKVGHRFIPDTVTEPASVSTFTWDGSKGVMYGWRGSRCAVCGETRDNVKYVRLSVSGDWEPVFDSRTNLTKGNIIFRFKDEAAYGSVKQVVYTYGANTDVTEIVPVNGVYTFPVPEEAAPADPIYIFVISE